MLRAVGVDVELRGGAPALALRRHLPLEAFEIDIEALARRDLLRQLERIAEGVVQRERLRARDLLRRLRAREDLIEQHAAALQRLAELRLLSRQQARRERRAVAQVRVRALHLRR